jgi:hypothetical protein
VIIRSPTTQSPPKKKARKKKNFGWEIQRQSSEEKSFETPCIPGMTKVLIDRVE